MSFTQLADECLLPSAKRHVVELQWNVEADGSLQRPPPSNVAGMFRMMPRRGLQPALVTRLLDEYPNRPLERALIAWDIARGSLLGRSDAQLLARLATELEPLKEIGATSVVAIPRDRIATLIDAARPSSKAGLLDGYLAMPSLAALVAMTRALRSLDDKPAFVAVTLDHAKLLSLAHLPTLALAFLQILWDRFALQPALDLMIEVALDSRQLDAVPQLEPHDERSAQQKAYGLLRAYLALRDIAAASTLNESLSRIPATRDSSDPALIVAKAELALLENKQIDPATIELVSAIAPPSSDWRYAVQVRESLGLLNKPHGAAVAIASYISRFGNNAEMWSRVAQHRPARNDLLKRLSREVRYVSHDPEVWRALAVVLPDGDSMYAEVQQRLDAQLSGLLTSGA